MTKRKKIILSISSVLLVLILYGWFFGVQTVCLIGLKFVDRSVVDAVPQPLDMGPASPAVTLLKTSDFSFSVPWTNCVQKELSAESTYWFCAESNVYVFCHNMTRMAELAVSAETREELDSVAGYAFKSNTFFMTSAEVSLFDSRDDARMKVGMLMCKMIGNTDALTGVYTFDYQDLKGFQRGTLSGNSMADLYLFDRQDREYQLLITVRKESPFVLTQSDINTIITTFSVEP